jgi:hypothetical protein
MGVARFTLVLGLLFTALTHAKAPAAFHQQVGEAEVDWSAGTITVQAGAAAALRMPNPSAARPGAERRARAAAEEKLRSALRALAGSTAVNDKVLSRASVSRIEYQSNGGVVLWLTLTFADVVGAKPAPVSLRVDSMPFALTPIVASGDKTAAVAVATYRPAAESPKGAIKVERNARGHLVIPGAHAQAFDSLAGAAVVIYLEKPKP